MMTKVWMHKDTGELALVKPYFDVWSHPTNGQFVISYATEQVAWVLVNQYEVTMILPMGVEKYFEDLGEL